MRITCMHCGDSYPDFDVAHVCSSGQYAPKLVDNKLKQIAGAALDKSVPYTWTTLDYEQIHKLLECHGRMIISEHLRIMQQEWYDINNTPVSIEGESPRDVGLRVGRKSQVLALMGKVQKHFGLTE